MPLYEYTRQARPFVKWVGAGSIFIASNSDPKNVNPEEDFLDNIYHNFSVKRVSASRMVNSNPTGRGAVSELMITNVIKA